jgi:hypothetical protein
MSTPPIEYQATGESTSELEGANEDGMFVSARSICSKLVQTCRIDCICFFHATKVPVTDSAFFDQIIKICDLGKGTGKYHPPIVIFDSSIDKSKNAAEHLSASRGDELMNILLQLANAIDNT